MKRKESGKKKSQVRVFQGKRKTLLLMRSFSHKNCSIIYYKTCYSVRTRISVRIAFNSLGVSRCLTVRDYYGWVRNSLSSMINTAEIDKRVKGLTSFL